MIPFVILTVLALLLAGLTLILARILKTFVTWQHPALRVAISLLAALAIVFVLIWLLSGVQTVM